MAKDKWETSEYYCGYSSAYQTRRTRTDWAGVGIGDAFKRHLDYFLRLSAQRLFYRTVKKAQAEVAALTGAGSNAMLEPKAKPQLGPCYSTYPSTPAAFAAVGLTAFLEFKSRVQQNLLRTRLQACLANPAEADRVEVDSASYQFVGEAVTQWVQTRLLLEDLSRHRSLSSVEIYRLFSASQEDLSFTHLPAIIRAVVLFGDLLPDWEEIDLHPLTRNILRDLTAVSAPFFEKISTLRGPDLIVMGESWVRAACRSLAEYLPPPKEEEENDRPEIALPGTGQGEPKYRFGKEKKSASNPDRIGPLEGPSPPTLQEPRNMLERVVTAAGFKVGDSKPGAEANPKGKEMEQLLQGFAEAIEGAGGQSQGYEDMRSDILENALRASPFAESPITGSPAEGHELTLKLDGDKEVGGQIFDRPVELSANQAALDKLLEESSSIAEALRRSLYPNIQQVPETQRLRTSGSLDPARLPLANFVNTVFRRYRIREKADRRGRPVLVIVCDGSGSLNAIQMKMLKLLAAGWLVSTVKSDVQILAGLYNCGPIRQGLYGPIVQWIYHPKKTPAAGRRDAISALVSLPDTGQGDQSDALSLAFILKEARQIARGSMIYLILITDTLWIRSFNTQKDGKEEMLCLFKSVYQEFQGKLHTTLVALSVQGVTGFEDILDSVITVSNKDLVNYSAVAEKIGVYVAACMKERRRLVEKQ